MPVSPLRLAGPCLAIAAASGCGAPDASAPPPPRIDEQRALADARAMIPADERAPSPAPPASAPLTKDSQAR